jgi:SpoVK/Ycf46/Vps4 family AAA+-type ATPase
MIHSTAVLDQLMVTAAHFQHALKLCAPSALRETKVEIPNSKWEDIGGLEEVCVCVVAIVVYFLVECLWSSY